MPKFKPARLVPKLFTGVPVSGATYDLSAYSANTIAPYELGLNSSAQTIVVNFGGTIKSFDGSGVAYLPTAGGTMTGTLNIASTSVVQFTNSSGSTGTLTMTGNTANRTYQLPNKSGVLALDQTTVLITGSTTATTATQVYFCDTRAGDITIYLPTSRTVGDRYWFYDANGSFTSKNLRLEGNDKNINGASFQVLDVDYEHGWVIYNGTQWNLFKSA